MTDVFGHQPRPSWLTSSPLRELWEKAALVADALDRHGLTLTTAESLTGGWISTALTSIPGISKYYLAGLVTYSNESKMELLGVPKEVIVERGAVSHECAFFMATGARKAGASDWSLVTTGIAGPDGGSKEKPVGLVFVGVSDGARTVSKRLFLSGDRLRVTLSAALEALTFLYGELINLNHG
ncbi:MAG: CinA family protein [Deltaproteobacteria bacterium]|jgi:PncC family amidohydrolase|nr:CinA family protein [Deltaproteobacteria bacterium]